MTGEKFEDTGYLMSDAIREAAHWWDKTGRGMVSPTLDKFEKTRISTSASGPMIKVKDRVSETDSGILHGRKWAKLTQIEQMKVVKVWHENFVRFPMIEERVAAESGTVKVLTITCDHPLHDVNVQRVYEIKGPNVANVTMQAEQAGFYLSNDHDFCPPCVAAFQQTYVAGSA